MTSIARPTPAVEVDTPRLNGRVSDHDAAFPPAASMYPQVVKKPGPEAAGGDLWRARSALHRIHQYAQSRHTAPLAVLGVVLTRVLLTTPPNVVLPPIIGGDAAPNLFVALIGASGAGKGTSEAAGRDAVDIPVQHRFDTMPLGSGEGLSRSYASNSKDGLVWERRRVLFTASEVDSLAALGSRQGATLPEQLRKLYMGECIGFSYAAVDKKVILPDHSYRAGLIIGVQPERAAAVISDTQGHGGTPQRFLWMPTRITRPAVIPTNVAPLLLPELHWQHPVETLGRREEVFVPTSVSGEIIDAHYARNERPGVDPLDGHGVLTRLKVAFALGLLDERKCINEEDWQLAGVVMDVSNSTRAAVLETLGQVEAGEHQRLGKARAVQHLATAEFITADQVDRAVTAIGGRIKDTGPLTRTELSRAVSGNTKAHLDAALDRLIKDCQVLQDGEVLRGMRTADRPGPAVYTWIG